MQVIAILLFVAGLCMVVFRFIAGLNFSRTSGLYYRSFVQDRRWLTDVLAKWKASEEQSKGGQKLRQRLHLAGYPLGLTVFAYNLVKMGLFLLVTSFFIVDFIYRFRVSHNLLDFRFFSYAFAVTSVLLMPDLLLALRARSRKTQLLFEISKLSHRLTMCMSNKSDLRETILRASRTLVLLKPYINELSTNWNTGQEAAILEFGRQVGITEVYPLVNTLLAISTVEVTEIADMLEQQVDSIDKSLDFEIQKKIENAPLGIIFLIIIPFFIVLVLMIYPWMTYLSEQLTGSFGGGGLP
ncbi:hypothetical protein B5M42_000045 [Paenibacillus athensensis]|uniref:Type II secretion system protein GspF domain-containing protein n=1 Tax=Paenibacillus athensensis TaxID=1967502 RepID=A0A4Y8PS66_9BACL|nr:hypothetical protein [Paenibacillus athensensis]MCD1257224.1 hypothetical protein [Paenibacillus athensensis]